MEAAKSMSRLVYQRFAAAFTNDDLFSRVYPTMRPVDQRATIIARRWALHGMQSVQMPATFEAALMATDSREVIGEEPLPWPAFEIQVCSGVITSKNGGVFSIVVSDFADPMATLTGPYSHHRFAVALVEPLCVTVNTFANLADMFNADEWNRDDEATAREKELLFENEKHLYSDQANDLRMWALAARLVCGVVLSINQARSETPGAYAARAKGKKRGHMRPSTFVLGKPLTLDVRQSLRDFMLGARRSEPKVTTLVRGHWKRQVHGPSNTLRRLQWIQPFYRGEGPRLVRPTRLGFGHSSEPSKP